eukprot:10181615-Alexandrium_andersonii.AAC.1
MPVCPWEYDGIGPHPKQLQRLDLLSRAQGVVGVSDFPLSRGGRQRHCLALGASPSGLFGPWSGAD